MKNVGGTEVISRALEVLFVAGLLPARPAALQLVLLLPRQAGWLPSHARRRRGTSGPVRCTHRPARPPLQARQFDVQTLTVFMPLSASVRDL